MDESKGQAGGVLTPVAISETQVLQALKGLGLTEREYEVLTRETGPYDVTEPRQFVMEFAKRIAALFTRPTPAAAADLTLKCLPNGVLFDAFGNQRVRYVRVIHDGTTCVVPPQEVESLVDSERPDDYRTEDVYLSKEEFDGLPEFDGF